MVTLKDAAQQALEALEIFARCYSDGNEAITALRAALAEQPTCKQPLQVEQEWDGSCVMGHCGSPSGCEIDGYCRVDRCTAPQPRREVELTDEDIQACGRDLFWPLDEDAPRFARAVIAAYKAKQGEQT